MRAGGPLPPGTATLHTVDVGEGGSPCPALHTPAYFSGDVKTNCTSGKTLNCQTKLLLASYVFILREIAMWPLSYVASILRQRCARPSASYRAPPAEVPVLPFRAQGRSLRLSLLLPGRAPTPPALGWHAWRSAGQQPGRCQRCQSEELGGTAGWGVGRTCGNRTLDHGLPRCRRCHLSRRRQGPHPPTRSPETHLACMLGTGPGVPGAEVWGRAGVSPAPLFPPDFLSLSVSLNFSPSRHTEWGPVG